jgi:hypothetical protein
VAENQDLEEALTAKTPLVIGVVLALGFLLLLVALQAPILLARVSSESTSTMWPPPLASSTGTKAGMVA